MPWRPVIGTSIAVSLLYAAGMAMNDAMDAQHDRVTAPHRPIPSGRVSLPEAWFFTGITAAMGLGVLALMGWSALITGIGLMIFIVGYNLLHKRLVIAVVLMGLCRGWVIVTAYAATIPAIDLRFATHTNTDAALPWFVLVLVLYVTAVTFVAQKEHARWIGMRYWIALVFPPLVVLLAMSIKPATNWSAAPALAIIAWLVRAASLVANRSPQIGRAVPIWLSGICLIDAYSLTVLDRPGIALIAAACFIMTVFAHRFIRGT